MNAIKVENLTKIYNVADSQEGTIGFRELISQQFLSLFSKQEKTNSFYALNDVSFEVKPGEVLGIIGKNGSGKSTLLKILSRITAPTSGKVTINGRVASLLEVGTGFHEDLTGRENIFMSGIILGMKRWEVYKYFDEIVAFAGVEKFIDTPVKKYSSGMRLRLAFSVAAHLQPEILLIDEVLAVGDYEFEKKCIGLMESVASTGRTILFVSHNFAVVRRLCKKAILLSQGKLLFSGLTNDAISKYMIGHKKEKGSIVWDQANLPGDEYITINSVKTFCTKGQLQEIFMSDEEILISVDYSVLKEQEPFSIMFWFYNDEGVLIFSSLDTVNPDWHDRKRNVGSYVSTCKIPKFLFNPGNIFVSLYIATPTKGWRFVIHEVISFLVVQPFENKKIVGDWRWAWPNVVIQPCIEWDVLYKRDNV